LYDSITDYTDLTLDANGIHVVVYSSKGQEIRDFTAADYGKPFSPSYAQILPNGNILVTNKAIGNGIAGELFELKWEWDAGKNANVYHVVWPAASVIFGSNSFGLRQPSSAERQVY